MKIEELLNKYFEGETTREEERELRRFFKQENLPQELSVYRPLFAYIEEEVAAHQSTVQKPIQKRPFARHFSTWGGIAAGVLLLIGVAGITRQLITPTDNYVWIDGVRHTDPGIVRQQAQAAFEDVSFTPEDIFNALFEE